MRARSSRGLGGESRAIGHGTGAGLYQRFVLRGELGGLLLAADFFRTGGLQLLLDLMDARGLRVGHALCLLEGCGGVASAFFQSGKRGGSLRCCLLHGFALLAQAVQLLLQLGRL